MVWVAGLFFGVRFLIGLGGVLGLREYLKMKRILARLVFGCGCLDCCWVDFVVFSWFLLLLFSGFYSDMVSCCLGF